MSEAVVRSIAARAETAAVEAAWAQWSALTTAAVPSSARPVWTIIDPEALVLLTLAIRDRERRSGDVMAAWLRLGSGLLSVQRLKTLAKRFPPPVREAVGDFAREAAGAGDRRWVRHAAVASGDDEDDRRKESGPLRLTGGAALMLRLRAGFGVGAKADLLAFLLGMHGMPAELRVVATATGYTIRALRNASDEMTLARLIRAAGGTPVSYAADHRRWADLLEIHRTEDGNRAVADVPPWRFWWVAFAFLTEVMAWGQAAETEGWSPYVASSRARDLVEGSLPRLRYLRWRMPDPGSSPGTAYLDAFARLVDEAAQWTADSLYGE
jgi:hypothetical protein